MIVGSGGGYFARNRLRRSSLNRARWLRAFASLMGQQVGKPFFPVPLRSLSDPRQARARVFLILCQDAFRDEDFPLAAILPPSARRALPSSSSTSQVL